MCMQKSRLCTIFIKKILEGARKIFIFLFEAQYLKTIGENKKIKIDALTSGDANKNCTKSRKALFTLFIAIIALTSSSFKKHSWQHEDAGHQTPNILRQFYPDQNAFRLLHMVPKDLRNLSFGIYTVSKGYDTVRFNYNKRFNLFPHVIFAPRTEEEVAYVLKALKKHNLRFSIR